MSSRARGTALPRSSPALAPALTACGCTRAAGWMPALIATMSLQAFQAAAASTERAELAVQTKGTPLVVRQIPGLQATASESGASRRYLRRRSPAEVTRSMSPARSSTSK